MLSHRRDPYLWIHLAGLATVPLWLDGCLVGLAVGEPTVPAWLELSTLFLVGTVPILWMQLRSPFYIFSVPGLALRPDQLADERRRLLTHQRGWLSRGFVLLAAIALWSALYGLYQIAPMATDLPWLTGQSRTTGWGLCAIAFFCANLFTLVPATVVPLFLLSPRRLEQIPPFEAADILSQFTVLGLRVGKILPEGSPTTAPLAETAATEPLVADPSELPAIANETAASLASTVPADSAETVSESLEADVEDPVPSVVTRYRTDQDFVSDTVDEESSLLVDKTVENAVEPTTAATLQVSDASPQDSALPISPSESDAEMEAPSDQPSSPTIPPNGTVGEMSSTATMPDSHLMEAEDEPLEDTGKPLTSSALAAEEHHATMTKPSDVSITGSPAHVAESPTEIASFDDEVVVEHPEEATLSSSQEATPVHSDEAPTPNST